MTWESSAGLSALLKLSLPGFTRWLCNFAADSQRFCYNRQVIYADIVAQK